MNELTFTGEYISVNMDMDIVEMVCVPSKPHYGAVDLCLKSSSDGKGGSNLVMATIDHGSLSFQEKKKLGYEIEKKWNAGK